MKHLPVDQTRQGVYTATPDGELLASSNPTAAAPTLNMLNAALAKWGQRTEVAASATTLPASDPDFKRAQPAGGLVLNVYSRIPLDFSGDRWNRNSSTGRDHAWLTGPEWRSLLPSRWQNGLRYPVPEKLVQRLARFHLVDNIRGEPDLWRRDQVLEAQMFLVVDDAAIHRLRLEGTARIFAQADPAPAITPGAPAAPIGGRLRPDRGCDLRVGGYLAYDVKKQVFTRVDLLAWGEAWGHGNYTPRPPDGRFPLLIAFSIAGNRPADRIPPQGARHRETYFGLRNF